MKTINTEFGKLYIDEADEIVDGKIGIYDSDKRDLGYWEPGTLERFAKGKNITIETALENWCKYIRNSHRISEILNSILDKDVEAIFDNKKAVKEYLDCDKFFDYKEADYINKIGRYYIIR
ncbi:MAG: hypothetical protein RR054_04445 [Clostridia bacterium]